MNILSRNVARSVLVPLALLSLPAMAQDDDTSSSDDSSDGRGFAVGVRAAYGIPFGDATDGNALSDVVSGTIAPQLDLGYFFSRNVYIGVYGQYGFAMLPDDSCPSGVDCSGSVLRFGLDLNYHFTSSGALTPWVGVGVGYEIAKTTAEAEGEELSGSVKGLEFVHLQGGVDFQLSKSISVGPYVTGTVGQYSSASVDLGEGSISADIEEKGMHFWLQPGVRLQIRM